MLDCRLYTVFGLENYQLLYIIAAEGAQCSVTADSGRTGSAGSVTASHAAAGRVAGHGSGGDTSQSGSPAAASASAASGGPTADSGSIVQDVKVAPAPRRTAALARLRAYARPLCCSDDLLLCSITVPFTELLPLRRVCRACGAMPSFFF